MGKCIESELDRQKYDEAPVDINKWPITEKLVLDCINEQLPSGEEGKYARLVKVNTKTVPHLKVEYKSVSLIDNLSSMTSLTKLQLSNNVITKIENLDALVNLVWLDLSFNCIRKIENLDSLKKLEVLNLHRNFISVLENMENQLRLEIFHISANKLDNMENVKYLRRFLRLRSGSFEGNPMSKNPNFLSYLVAFVPQLIMVDYKYVPKHERDVAEAKYKAQVDRLVATEDKFIRRASVVEAEEQVQLMHKDAFVDGYQEDKFWNALYENDEEGQAILQLSDTDDIQIMYRELFRRATKDIFEKGMKVYELRQNEIKAYNAAIKDEMDKVQKIGNELTEEFVEYGEHALKDIRILVNVMEDFQRRLQHGLAHDLPPEFPDFQAQLNDLCKEYVAKQHHVWVTLISNEMDFNEQLEDVNDLLDRSMREIFQNWVEQLRGQFSTMRDVELQLFARLIEALVTYGEFRMSDPDIPGNLKELVMDKDALTSHLQMSHDHHIAAIDGREDQMSTMLKNWQENFSIEVASKEYYRNRARLSEISHFTDTYSKYLEESRAPLHTTIYIPPVRADQECLEPSECQPLQWYERLTKRLRVKEKQFKASVMPRGKDKKQETVISAAPSEQANFVL